MLKPKIKDKLSGKALEKTVQPAGRAEYSFKLIVAIIERGYADDMVEMLAKDFGIQFHITCQGDGTADSTILQFLNLDKSAKDVVISVVDSNKCPSVLRAIQDAYEGSGIAFSVKLNSIGGMRTLQLLNGDLVQAHQKNDGQKE